MGGEPSAGQTFGVDPKLAELYHVEALEHAFLALRASGIARERVLAAMGRAVRALIRPESRTSRGVPTGRALLDRWCAAWAPEPDAPPAAGSPGAWRAPFLRALAEGKSVQLAADLAGVTRDRAYQVRRADLDFALAWDAARLESMAALYERRVGESVSDRPIQSYTYSR